MVHIVFSHTMHTKFEKFTRIISTIVLLTISIIFISFAVKEKIEHGPSTHTFVPYWMIAIGGLIILEQLIFYSADQLDGEQRKYFLFVGVILRFGVGLLTFAGVLISFDYIRSAGGFSEAPTFVVYGFSLGLLTLKVYICIFLKYLLKLFFNDHEDGVEIAYTEFS